MFQMLYIDLPLFMASTFSISSFYLVSQKDCSRKGWPRALLYFFLMALGIGLTITIRFAFSRLSSATDCFCTHPEYQWNEKRQSEAAKYAASGLDPWIEL